MPEIVGYRTRGPTHRRDALRRKPALFRRQQLATHFSERVAKFRHFAAAARIYGIRIISLGQRPDTCHQVVEGMRNPSRHQAEKQTCKYDGRDTQNQDSAIEPGEESISGL